MGSLSIFLCFILGAFGAVNYSQGMIGRYESYMAGILRYTLTEIDGDALEECINSGKANASYDRVQKVLDRIKETHDIEFIYIVKPLNNGSEDNMMNVMAGATAYEKAHEKDSLVLLGQYTGDAYSPEVAENYLKGMKAGGEEIT